MKMQPLEYSQFFDLVKRFGMAAILRALAQIGETTGHKERAPISPPVPSRASSRSSSSPISPSTDTASLRCSFCGRRRDHVENLIAGPGVYICAECVELCVDLMHDTETQGSEEQGSEGHDSEKEFSKNSGRDESSDAPTSGFAVYRADQFRC